MCEIYSAFHTIIDNIANTACQLPTLESWLNIKSLNEFIPVVLPEWFLQQSHQRLTQALEAVFQPINEYVEELDQQFKIVYNPETHQEIITYIAEGHDFVTCLDKVEEFKHYIYKINEIVRCYSFYFNFSYCGITIINFLNISDVSNFRVETNTL